MLGKASYLCIVIRDWHKKKQVKTTKSRYPLRGIQNTSPQGGREGADMIKRKASVTEYDNGKIVIDPYLTTGIHRYEPLIDTEYGSVTTTKQHFRVLLMFPRKAGILAAVRHLISETSRIATLMTNLSCKHNFS